MPDVISGLLSGLTTETSAGVIRSYLEGGSVKLTVVATDHDGAIIDPKLLRLLVLRPNATMSEQVLTTEDGETCTGVISLNVSGLWNYRFETMSGSPAAHEGRFMVIPRQVPPP